MAPPSEVSKIQFFNLFDKTFEKARSFTSYLNEEGRTRLREGTWSHAKFADLKKMSTAG